MSEVKVNKITPTADCGTVTLGDSGDTVAIPAGVTLTSGGALQNSGTITNTGTITGVAITGTIDNQVNWQTTVKTTGFTATAGEGYFCDTTSAAFTVTLPASPSAGDLVGIKDYANTADTNNITIGRNGSNIEGVANDFVINIEGGSITLIYVDATKGWLSTAAAKASDITEEPLFTTATGGTITTSGDYKIHTFTGPGTFTVTQLGNSTTVPTGGPNTASYLVIAGGASGGKDGGGGGGAGGFREGRDITPSYTASPLVDSSGLTLTASAFPITVGGGAAAPTSPGIGVNGTPSVFSTITGAGGGGGGLGGGAGAGGVAGGSGGGGAATPSSPNSGGAGNTPPVSPSQGNAGGSSGTGTGNAGGGGGGASATGGNGVKSGPSRNGGPGGNGIATSITGSPVTRAGGGGGGGVEGAPVSGGSGGGGASGGPSSVATAGTVNTGGGGGAGSSSSPNTGGAGGSGVVVIRYKFQ